MHICVSPQPPRPPPPAMLCLSRKAEGQASRFLDFLKEIKAKPIWGLVCNSLVSVWSTAVHAYAAFCCIPAGQVPHGATHGAERYGCPPPPPTHRGGGGP